MPDTDYVASALERVARRWRDPAHSPRAEAVERTLQAPNRFTEPALAFAINQQMEQLTAERMIAWAGSSVVAAPRAVGVLGAGNVPLADLQDFLAVVLTGHHFLGVTSSKSPHLLPAFVDELRDEIDDLHAAFHNYDEMLTRAEAVIATGSDETMAEVKADLDHAGIPRERQLLRGHRFGVAIIDGRETEQEREALAEDSLLHEGLGCRNVAIIWAPEATTPDPYLDAFAQFRGVFVAHERTPGSLKMHQAMLAAVDVPHAYADGLEFLMSKGDPEPQVPGHIRWSEYSSLGEVRGWLEIHRDEVQIAVARPHLASRLGSTTIEIVPPGEAQRPPLHWRPDGVDLIAFLRELF